MLKKIFSFFFFLLLVLLGVGFWGYQQLQQFKLQHINAQPNQLITLERGTTSIKLAALLEQEKLVDDAKWLPWLLKIEPQLNKVKSGTYSLNGINNLQDLLQLLNSGKEAQFTLRFIEGDSFKTWRAQLAKAPYLQQSLQNKSEQDIANLLAIPTENIGAELARLEGWFYPDTYYYSANSTDLELLKRAYNRMQQALNKAWAERDPDLPLTTPYQMLILASIVEKETALEKERRTVAAVFINRLRIKMKLQTDPTVIYGMGERYQGNITRKDLETPTAYNTYTIEGLPPTPIAMPSENALLAVAHPEKNNYLYFVADGTGGHKFSRTLNEHQKAVQEYLHWYRQNKNN